MSLGKKRKQMIIKIILTIVAVTTAVITLIPIVLTFTNSLMASSEITSNYGMIFEKTDTGGKKYISETVNLKFIKEMVRI